MNRVMWSMCLVVLLAAVAIGGWAVARACAQAPDRWSYQVKFDVGDRPVDDDLLARQIEQATGLKLSDLLPDKERDGVLTTRGPEERVGPGRFQIVTDITVLTARPLTPEEEAAMRAVIAAHTPARLVAFPPDWARRVQRRLSAKGVDAVVTGNPQSGFRATLQGPVTDEARSAFREAVSEWDYLQVAE